jgi:hypothetical protein
LRERFALDTVSDSSDCRNNTGYGKHTDDEWCKRCD